MLALVSKQRTPYWHIFKELNGMISSTSIASIFHASPHKSKMKLYREVHLKTNEKGKKFESEAMRYGKEKEQDTLDKAFEFLLKKGMIEDGTDYRIPGTLIDMEHPICCSPDALYLDSKGLMHGVEVKTMFSSCCPLKIEKVPFHYLLQCMVCLHVHKAEDWVLYFHDHNREHYSAFLIKPNLQAWDVIVEQTRKFIRDKDKVPGRKTKKDAENLKKFRGLIEASGTITMIGHVFENQPAPKDGLGD